MGDLLVWTMNHIYPINSLGSSGSGFGNSGYGYTYGYHDGDGPGDLRDFKTYFLPKHGESNNVNGIVGSGIGLSQSSISTNHTRRS